jgi:hypothetical protein
MNGTVGALGPNLFRAWLLAHFVAFTIGGVAGGGVLRALEQPYYGHETSALDAGLIQGGSLAASTAIFGAIVGTAQWLVLRRSIRAGWWPVATAVGWGGWTRHGVHGRRVRVHNRPGGRTDHAASRGKRLRQ